MAAKGICVWVHAVYAYRCSTIHTWVEPEKKEKTRLVQVPEDEVAQNLTISPSCFVELYTLHHPPQMVKEVTTARTAL